MKRRNADCGKLRRPIKRNKITEGMYGSTTVLYMKFLVLWAIVITADFMFMFRFEFLWPFWLLLRSVHDSFKYKGLAFSVLFVCIAITSDLVCLFFIPVHWLLFAASTYVWVQYVWHTDKGICLPTIILWMLFVYLEAGIRWKDSRHMPHLDLCRPFAAHCIGYPVVTLGFGFKSYVGYRMRQRKQREVAKENEFYMQLLQQALPQEEPITVATATIEGTTPNLAMPVTNTQNITAVATTTTSTISSSPLNQSAQNLQSNLAALVNGNTSIATPLTTTALPSTLNGIVSSTPPTLQIHQNHTQHQQNIQQQHNVHQNNNSLNLPNGTGNSITSTTSSNGITISGNMTTSPLSSSFNDEKDYEEINTKVVGVGVGDGGGNVTANGHIGNSISSKSQRRSADKENKNRNCSSSSSSTNETDLKRNNNHKGNNSLQVDNNSNNNNNNYSSKEKVDTEHATPANNNKDKNDDHKEATTTRSNSNSSRKSNTTSLKSNESNLPYEIEEIVTIEPVERTKGRRNRSKKDNAALKDNHQNSNNNSNSSQNCNNSNHQNNHTSNNHQTGNNSKDNSNTSFNFAHNFDASSVSSSASSSSMSTSLSAASTAASTISNIASKVVSKICESCLKFEADIKKYRSEISHMKQIENELRQKLESNLTTKSCLQAKQKECDDLEKRILELTNARHADYKAAERRLTEERRQKQSLESQLSNEKKARKLAEEKAARPECSVQCKQRKQQMEEEIKQLRRELKATDEAKLLAEQHGRKWEQELRMFEAEIRNRDSNQQGTEILVNALAAMQDKNCTLEKNLSAETRVKLDLFSALGDAKRQLEISESRRRSKEDEILDLKAKIAQLLAVMPTDSLCLPACSSTGAASMLRMNDTPPLQTGPGPASPMLGTLTVQAISNVAPTTRVVTSSGADYVQQAPPDYVNSHSHQQQLHQQHQLQHQMQQQQQQCSGMVPVSVANAVLTVVGNGGGAGASNLDPNATIYTPKNVPNVASGVVVVGGTNGDA